MKKQLIILGIAVSLITSACTFNNSFKGDENVVRKGKNVETFQTIEVGGSIDNMKVYFTQDSTAPLIRIEVDSNVLEKMAIFVKNNTLTIKKKDGFEQLHLSPSICNIYCNAAVLKEVVIMGSGSVICQTPLTGEALDVRIIGSGDFTAEQPSSITHFNSVIAGSGDIIFSGSGQTIECNLYGSGDMKFKGNYANLEARYSGSGDISYEGDVQEVNLQQSGSGDLLLIGHIDKANLQIAGSGDVNALKCTIKQLEAQISGSGDISAEVLEMLSVKINGSGSVLYKGNPTVNSNITGSGEVKRIE